MINLSFSIDRSHLLYSMITLYSVLKNNPNNYFNVYILHLDSINQQKIDYIIDKYPLNQYSNFKIHLIDVSTFKEINDLKTILNWTKEIYLKIYLPVLLPQCDKILHLDSDVLCINNIESFYNNPLDVLFYGDGWNYINVGIMVINLNKARSLNITKNILDIMIKNNITEQEAINILYPNEYKLVDKNFIYTTHEDLINKKNVTFIHYTYYKPWNIDQTKAIFIFKKKYLQHYYNYLKAFIDPKYNLKYQLFYIFISTIGPFILSIYKRLNNFYRKKTHKPKSNYNFCRQIIYKLSYIKQYDKTIKK